MNPYRVNSFQECYDDFFAKNKVDASCRAFTFRGSNGGGDCLLKQRKGNENKNNGATSGTTINCNWSIESLNVIDDYIGSNKYVIACISVTVSCRRALN